MKKIILFTVLFLLGGCASDLINPNIGYYKIVDLHQQGERETGKQYPLLSGLLPLKNGNAVVWLLTHYGTVAFELDPQGNKLREIMLNIKKPNKFVEDYKAIAYLEEREGGLWGIDWTGQMFDDKNGVIGYIDSVDVSTVNGNFGTIHWVSKLADENYLVFLKNKETGESKSPISLIKIDKNGKRIDNNREATEKGLGLMHVQDDRVLGYANNTVWQNSDKLHALLSKETNGSYQNYTLSINLKDLSTKQQEIGSISKEAWAFGYENRLFLAFINRQKYISYIRNTSFSIRNEAGMELTEKNTPVPLNSSGTDLFIIPNGNNLYVVHNTKEYNIEIVKYSGLENGLPKIANRTMIRFGFIGYLLQAKMSEDGNLFLLVEPTMDEKEIGLAVIKVPKENL